MPATYEPIATTTLGSADTVTFSSISSTYTDLVLVCLARGSYADPLGIVKLRFNGDSGSNYSSTKVYGDGSSAGSGRSSNQTAIEAEYIVGSTGASNSFGLAIFQFSNYSNATTYKSILHRCNNAASFVSAGVHTWRSTSAISSIAITESLGTNFAAGSTFTLYGVKAA